MATYQSKHTGAEIDAGIDAAYAAIPRSGGAMTGALVLSDDPISDKGAATKQYVDSAIENMAATPGNDGKSAYEIAVDEGFEGSQSEWLESLKGEDGERGERGENGSDGVSPTVVVASISGGHRVNITDVNGTQSFDVMDGVDGSGGDGSGDMLKSTYDSNNNGVVDNAEKLGGKTPDQYAMANHSHNEYLTGFTETDPTVPSWAKAAKKPTYAASEIVGIIDLIYPVGSIYLSVNATNPVTLFGGQWARIKDSFLLSAGDTYAAGTTGGEAKHTLTIGEMPAHTHNIAIASSGQWSDGFGLVKGESFKNRAIITSDESKTTITLATGNNVPHNNMPPYLAVYVWKRIS